MQKNENLGFDESIDASIREAEEHNRFKRMHLRNPTQENQVGFKTNIFRTAAPAADPTAE